MTEKISYKNLLDTAPSLLLRAKQDALLLVENKVWDSISEESLESWLNNFESEEEKLLSAYLLDALIFRSSDQIKALLYNAIESVLPNTLIENPWDVLANDRPIDKLTHRNTERYKTRIVPVIRDSDPPTKSGPSVARLYRRHVGISDDFMIWPWMIKKNHQTGVKTFVFIDDVLGTGKQFSEFFEKLGVDCLGGAEFIYIPLLATVSGIKNVKEKFPFLKVAAVEMIDETYNFFNRPSVRNIFDLQDLYLKVEKNKVNKRLLGKMSLGYSKLGLTFSYYHSTPNATLPLYWYEDDSFSPLVKR
jgi:uracil phosphoribosyltransferase